MKLGELEVHIHSLPKEMDRLCQVGKFRVAVLPDQTVGSLYRLLCVIPEGAKMEMFATDGKEVVIIAVSKKFKSLPPSTSIQDAMIEIAPESVFETLKGEVDGLTPSPR